MNMEKIAAELQKCVETLGFEYVGVESVKEAGTQTLRLYADKVGGISLDDCEKIAQDAGTLLDAVADDFEDNYLLEVSSPGLERPLFKPADYEKFTGRPAALKLKSTVAGHRRVSAMIEGVADGVVKLDCGGEPLEIPFDQIARAHLIYVEEKGQKKTFKKKGGRK